MTTDPPQRATADPPNPHVLNSPKADRLGLWLFAFYTSLYLGFVLINAFAPTTMEINVVLGLNLAIVYGFGLIIAAVILALIYGLMRKDDDGGNRDE